MKLKGADITPLSNNVNNKDDDIVSFDDALVVSKKDVISGHSGKLISTVYHEINDRPYAASTSGYCIIKM